MTGSDRKSYGRAPSVFFCQIVQELPPLVIPIAPLTQIELARKKTRKSANNEIDPDCEMLVRACPPRARYARIARATANDCCAVLKITFKGCFLTTSCSTTAEMPTASTVVQWGAT